jgi:hypothetical protein
MLLLSRAPFYRIPPCSVRMLGGTCLFRLLFAMVKIQGDSMHGEPHLRYIVPLPNIFPNSFFLKNEIEKEGLPRSSPPGLGAGGPEFKSRSPDHLLFYFQLPVGSRVKEHPPRRSHVIGRRNRCQTLTSRSAGRPEQSGVQALAPKGAD